MGGNCLSNEADGRELKLSKGKVEENSKTYSTDEENKKQIAELHQLLEEREKVISQLKREIDSLKTGPPLAPALGAGPDTSLRADEKKLLLNKIKTCAKFAEPETLGEPELRKAGGVRFAGLVDPQTLAVTTDTSSETSMLSLESKKTVEKFAHGLQSSLG